MTARVSLALDLEHFARAEGHGPAESAGLHPRLRSGGIDRQRRDPHGLRAPTDRRWRRSHLTPSCTS